MADQELEALESVASPWSAHDETVATTGFWTMARRLPGVLSEILRSCWAISRRDTALLVVCTLTAELFTAVGLLATTGVLEDLFAAGPTPDRVRAALPGLILIVASVVLRAALREAAGWARSRLSPLLRREIETGLLELTTGVELVAFDDSAFNDALHRVRDNAPRVFEMLLYSGLQLAGSVIQIIAVAGVLTVLHPALLPVLFLAVTPVWWSSVRSARQAYQFYYGFSGAERRKGKLAELMAERESAAELRSYTMRPFLLGQFDRVSAYVRDADLTLARRHAVNQLIGSGLGGIGTGLVYLALAVLLLTGAMALAVAGTALIAVRTALGALAGIGSTVNGTYEQALFYDDYQAFRALARHRQERRGGTPPPADLDRIQVRDVTFTYPSAETPALDGVTLDIHPGEVIALVGENGSGKSTLAKLLSGLYQPEQGMITYGGVPLGEIDLPLLRDRCSVIAQNFTHWPFTAAENITMGAPAGARLTDAAVAAGADEVFARLPKGADTLLDASFKGGTELSGGQWQRIAVARGLYRDAPLLICDEPTAALDARTEHAIFQAIREHAAQRTVVLITHRMASVRYADRIYVLERGRVAEHGTHHELMARHGIYEEFYSLQASAYAPDEPMA